MKFSIRTLLLIIALAAVTIGVIYPIWQFEHRKTFTRPALEITNGTPGDQAMRQTAATVIEQMSAFSQGPPQLISVRVLPGKHRYFIVAYWTGHSKVADGLELTFADGRKVISGFSKDESGGDRRTLFFSAMVFSELLPKDLRRIYPAL